mmetsp:Transcript_13101/g.52243  ORF Transcript_13101/g.52243 Transcript_13101/m.52243 type:complete len:1086 (+) Transcript_13101:260-3517(+)
MSEHEADRDDEIVETADDGRFVRFGDKLGSGAFKTVYRGFDTERGIEVAWNQVLYERYNLDLSRVMNEIEVFKSIRNPHIIEFYSAWQDTDAKQVVFITELMPSGTLKQFTSKTPNVKLKVLKNWCKQILMGLDYLHSLSPPIIHRDIKCDNIFINGLSEGEVKIGDFGLATFSSREQGMSLAGTPEFMAPEFYSDQYSTAVDIWAFGMLVIEMVTHEFPYSECKGIHQICGKVTKGIMPSQLDRITHPALVDFITCCLIVEGESRPTAAALLTHPFFEEESDGDLAIGDLLAPAEPVEEPAVAEAPAADVVIVQDQPTHGLALNTPYPQANAPQAVNDPSGYLSPPNGYLSPPPNGTAPPPEAALLTSPEAVVPQPMAADPDGYLSHGQLYQPPVVSDGPAGYHSDISGLDGQVAVGFQTVPPAEPSTYLSDGAVYSDGGYEAAGVDPSVTSPLATPPRVASPAPGPPAKKALVSAEVVYLNAVNAGDGQLGLRMNIVTSDGVEQYTDEVSFDFMLNSDTPASIAVEMLRIFNLQESALPQLEATISERVFYLARSATETMPVQLEPDFEDDSLLVDGLAQTTPHVEPVSVEEVPAPAPHEVSVLEKQFAEEPAFAVDPPVYDGVESTDAALAPHGDPALVNQPAPGVVLPKYDPAASSPRAGFDDTATGAGDHGPSPLVAANDGLGPTAGENTAENNGLAVADRCATPPVPSPSPSALQTTPSDSEATTATEVFVAGEQDISDDGSTALGMDVVMDEDEADGDDGPLVLQTDDEAPDESTVLVEDSDGSSALSVEPSDTLSLSDPLGRRASLAESDPMEAYARTAATQASYHSASPETPRRDRSRPRSHTSPMVVPMIEMPQGATPRSPGVPSVFSSPFPNPHRFSSHLRRESSDMNSSFKFVLPPEEDDIEELESYLDNESSPTKEGSSQQLTSDLLSSTSAASQQPRSTTAEYSNSDLDAYDYFTDDGGSADPSNIYIEEEEEEEEEDTEMMRLRAKQQLELQRLIHAHERELAAAKQQRLRRTSMLRRKNAHLMHQDPSTMFSDEEGYRLESTLSLGRSFSVPPEELLLMDESSDGNSAG